MKKLIPIFGIVFVLLSIFGVTFFLSLKSQENDRLVVSSNLFRAIQKNKSNELDVVDISLLTSFEWDKLYFFGPYTLHEDIDKVLGRYWIGSRFSEIESSDNITLLVFTKNRRIVQFLEFPRSQGDFSILANLEGYLRTEAQFAVDEKGQMIWAPILE